MKNGMDDDIKVILNQADVMSQLRDMSAKLCKVLTHARNPIYKYNLSEEQILALAHAEEEIFGVLQTLGGE